MQKLHDFIGTLEVTKWKAVQPSLESHIQQHGIVQQMRCATWKWAPYVPSAVGPTVSLQQLPNKFRLVVKSCHMQSIQSFVSNSGDVRPARYGSLSAPASSNSCTLIVRQEEVTMCKSQVSLWDPVVFEAFAAWNPVKHQLVLGQSCRSWLLMNHDLTSVCEPSTERPTLGV